MTATRREWNELYVFFALLGQGSIALGDAEGKASPRVLPIARISRQEHDGKRDYLVEKNDVCTCCACYCNSLMYFCSMNQLMT